MAPKTRDHADKENEQFGKIQESLDRLFAAVTSVDKRVERLETKFDSLEKKIDATIAEVHTQGVRLDSHDQRIKSLETKLQDLDEAYDLLENRMRRNNLRILNIPEGAEKENLTGYVLDLITDELQVEITSEDLERCHRIGVSKKADKYPRIVICKLRDYQTKIDILKAHNQPDNQPEGIRRQKDRIRFVPDLSAQLRGRRAEYFPIREVLDKQNIKSQLRYPSVLWVWKGTTKMEFPSAEEALKTLKETFPLLDDLQTVDIKKWKPRDKTA